MKLSLYFATIAQATALATKRSTQPGVTFFTDIGYNGVAWQKTAPSGVCVRLDPSVLRMASSLHLTGACCRLYTAEDCNTNGGLASTTSDVYDFRARWGSSINDAVVSYHCLLTNDNNQNPYCTVNGRKRDISAEEVPAVVHNSTHELDKRVADPFGRVEYVSIGTNSKNRIVTALATTITTNSAIYDALGSITSVALAVARNTAQSVKDRLGLYPSATYAYWSSAVTGGGQTVYTIIVKYVWNGGYGLTYQNKLAVAAAISAEYGFGIVAENFVPDTHGVVAMRKREIQGAVCPAGRSAAGAGISTSGTFVRYAATCDQPPSQYCLTQGDC